MATATKPESSCYRTFPHTLITVQFRRRVLLGLRASGVVLRSSYRYVAVIGALSHTQLP